MSSRFHRKVIVKLVPAKICSRNGIRARKARDHPGETASIISRALCPVNGKGDERKRTSRLLSASVRCGRAEVTSGETAQTRLSEGKSGDRPARKNRGRSRLAGTSPTSHSAVVTRIALRTLDSSESSGSRSTHELFPVGALIGVLAISTTYGVDTSRRSLPRYDGPQT